MYVKLSEVELKTGELMEVDVVLAPDNVYADRIKQFLDHKPGDFKWHIERSVEEDLDELETRYYIGLIDGEVISNVMVVEHRHTGILGHAFTAPQHRRKGAYTGVMAAQMDDFRQRGGEALYLGTGYDGPAYHIYKSFGFESVTPKSGFMKYWSHNDFEAQYFTKCQTHVKEVQWRDWPKMTPLTSLTYGDYFRSIAFNAHGPTSFEGGFLGFKHELESGKQYRDAKLLESKNGAIVAFSTLIADSRWRDNVHILDIFAHPDFWDDASKLLDALNMPQSKIQCYVDSIQTGKAECLEKMGFHHEATLKRQIRHGSDALDVHIFAKL